MSKRPNDELIQMRKIII